MSSIRSLSLYKTTNFKIGPNSKQKFFLGLVENIVGEGENADISIFSFSHNVFKRLLLQGL